MLRPPAGERELSHSVGSPMPTRGGAVRAPQTGNFCRLPTSSGTLGTLGLALSSEGHLLNLCEEPHGSLFHRHCSFAR